MKQKLSTRKVIIQELNRDEKDALEQALYSLLCKIFDNVSFEVFCHYVTRSAALKTTLLLYENRAGETVGFFALHVFKNKVKGRISYIFRGQTGLLPEYRRSKANMYFSLFQVLKYRVLHPFTPLYCILSIVNPSMYAVLSKNLLLLIPRYNRRVRSQQKVVIEEIARQFSFKDSIDGKEWTTPVGWISRTSEKEREYWNRSHNPHICFFLENNPGYAKGMGLVTLVPFSWSNIILSSFKVLGYILKKKFL